MFGRLSHEIIHVHFGLDTDGIWSEKFANNLFLQLDSFLMANSYIRKFVNACSSLHGCLLFRSNIFSWPAFWLSLSHSHRSWIIDSRTIARKVRNISQSSSQVIKDCDAKRECPNCHFIIDNTDVSLTSTLWFHNWFIESVRCYNHKNKRLIVIYTENGSFISYKKLEPFDMHFSYWFTWSEILVCNLAPYLSTCVVPWM